MPYFLSTWTDSIKLEKQELNSLNGRKYAGDVPGG